MVLELATILTGFVAAVLCILMWQCCWSAAGLQDRCQPVHGTWPENPRGPSLKASSSLDIEVCQ